jgi:hypothetical protein
MTNLAGADSAVPQPTLYHGFTVWGCYVAGDTPLVWSRSDVAALGAAGIKGVVPVVVPPQTWPWPPGALATLVAKAKAWGVPADSPLVLDVEQGTAQAMTVAEAAQVDADWSAAWTGRSVIYSGTTMLDNVSRCARWLAQWPDVTPVNPDVPAGYFGWQYAGNAMGGAIDLDVFADGETFMLPDCSGVVVLPPNPQPPPDPPTHPEETTMYTVPVTGADGQPAAGRYLVGIPDGDAAPPWSLPISGAQGNDLQAWQALGAKPAPPGVSLSPGALAAIAKS